MPQKVAKITTRELTRLDKERVKKERERSQEIKKTRVKGEVGKIIRYGGHVILYEGLDI